MVGLALQEAWTLGLRGISRPKLAIAAARPRWSLWLTLLAMCLLIEVAPAILVYSWRPGYAEAYWAAYRFWAIPAVLALMVAILLLWSYFAAFSWASLRIVSRSASFPRILTSFALAFLVTELIGFVPHLAITLAEASSWSSAEVATDVFDKLTSFLSGVYSIVMVAHVAGIGVGLALVLNLLASVAAIVVGVGIAWVIALTFPEVGVLIESYL